MNPKLLGIPTQLYARPLTQALRTNEAFQLIEDSRPNIARQLREQELSAALLSPLEYAKESSDYCIVPDAAIVSTEGNGSILVRFREGIQSIKTLAVDPNFAAEIVLAKIILSEQFDIEPAILPMIAPVEIMLQKADAALIAGDAAVRSGKESGDVIDLIEEWKEMMDLPFVHALWCGREGNLNKADIEQLQQAAVKGEAGIGDIVLAYLPDERDDAGRYLQSFMYTMDDDAKAGLGEFMKYLYYHCIQPDVAELNFYGTEGEEKSDLLSDLLPN